MVLCFVHTSSHVFILYGSYFLGPESSAWWRKDQPTGHHLGAGGMRNPMLDPRPTGQSRHVDEAFRGSLPTWRSEEPGSRQRVCHHDDLGAAPCFSAMCPLERVQSHGLNHFHRFDFLGQVSYRRSKLRGSHLRCLLKCHLRSAQVGQGRVSKICIFTASQLVLMHVKV